MTKKFLLVFITALLLAACSASPQLNTSKPNPQGNSNQPAAPADTQPAPSNQPNPQETPNQPAAAADTQPAPSLSPDEVYQAVKAAWDKLATAGPRHVSQTTSEGGVVGMSTEADVVPPGFHQVVSVNGAVVAEQYIVDGIIYGKDQGGWSQAAGGSGALSMIGDFTQSFSKDLIYSDGVVNGIEVFNGSPAIVYSYSTTLQSVNASAKYKLWVDQASGLPVKSENITPEGSTIDMTITYDPGITISLPDEAKNAPPAQ
jgi:hypothetical protein